MNNAFGYKSNVYIQPQESYKDFAFEGITKEKIFRFNDLNVEMERNDTINERNIRTGKIHNSECSQVLGKRSGKVTVSGKLTFKHLEKFVVGSMAYNNLYYEGMGKATPPTSTTIDNDLFSFCFIKVYNPGETTEYKDIAYGCVLESVEFSQEDSFYNFSATYDARSIDLNNKSALGGTSFTDNMDCEPVVKPTYSKLFLRKDGTNVLPITPINFNLSFSYEFAEDIVNYGLKEIKDRLLVINHSATGTFDFLVENTNMGLPDTLDHLEFELTLMNSASDELVMVGNGLTSSVKIPDVEKGVYTGTIEINLLSNDKNDTPWEINI